jgi:Flp pilus assembly pilin Flp
VGQAFRGWATPPSPVTISVVTKSHLFAWITLTRKAGSHRLDSVRARFTDAEGQTLVEYTLTVSLLAIVCIAALTATGRSLSGILISIAGQV